MLRLVKNTYINHEVMDKYFEQIEEFYKGSQSVEYSNNWRSIFELYLLCGENDRARKLYVKIIDEIKKLNFNLLDDDELLEKGKRILLPIYNMIKLMIFVTMFEIPAPIRGFAMRANGNVWHYCVLFLDFTKLENALAR